jgi:dihydrofolate reductase
MRLITKRRIIIKEAIFQMGANVGQQLLRAGLADELEMTIAPIILGKGLRLFEHLADLEIKLEKLRTLETKQQVVICYKVSHIELIQ